MGPRKPFQKPLPQAKELHARKLVVLVLETNIELASLLICTVAQSRASIEYQGLADSLFLGSHLQLIMLVLSVRKPDLSVEHTEIACSCSKSTSKAYLSSSFLALI